MTFNQKLKLNPENCNPEISVFVTYTSKITYKSIYN